MEQTTLRWDWVVYSDGARLVLSSSRDNDCVGWLVVVRFLL